MPLKLTNGWYLACWTSVWMYLSVGLGAIISRPASQVVLPGQREVVFICAVTDFGIWFVNGTGLYDTNADAFQRRGITYDISEAQSANGNIVTNLSLVIENRPENNGTYIQCYSYGSEVETSPYAWMIVAGPPLAPSPVVQILNMTHIALVWDKPFTWTEVADIEYYTVLMYNDTSQVWTNWTHMRVGSATRHTHYLSTEGVAEQCKALKFMVSATNIVGSSKYGSVTGGYPIQLKWSNELNGTSRLSVGTMLYTMPEKTIQVNCTVEPPVMCGYQQATFRVIVSSYKSGFVVASATVLTYLQGNVVTIPLSFKLPTSEDTDYNVILVASSFGTELQAVTSLRITTSLLSNNEKENDIKVVSKALVVGVASGSLAVVAVIIASIATWCTARKLKKVAAAKNHRNSHSANDYYEAPPLPPRLEHLYDHIPDRQKSSVYISMKLDILESELQMLGSEVMHGSVVSSPPRPPEQYSNSSSAMMENIAVEDYVDMGAVFESSQVSMLKSERSVGSCGDVAVNCGQLSAL